MEIGAKSRNIKGHACISRVLNYFHTRRRGKMPRDEDRYKIIATNPVRSWCGGVRRCACRSETETTEDRRDARGGGWRGGKTISWEKGAGVTRPTPWRTSEPLHARTRASARANARTRTRVWNTWSRPRWACVKEDSKG